MKTAQTIAAQQAQGTESHSEATPKRGQHPNSLKNLVKPWQPGQSGNPSGRKRDRAGEIARQVLENNEEEIYRALGAKLMQGDAYAFSVLADRGYGKLKQGIIHTGDEEGGPIQASIKVEFVKPSKK